MIITEQKNRESLKIGDKIKIVDGTDENFGQEFFVVKKEEYVFFYSKNKKGKSTDKDSFIGYYFNWFYNIVPQMPNREYLADFIKMNNIKMTKVSKTVGKARNWLHVMVTEKRRGDLSDKALQSILKLIHIDWTKDQLINVKATKEHTAYFTRTSTYKTDAHKERLQRAMWNGEFLV